MKNTPITENHLYQKAYSRGKNVAGKYVVVYVLRDKANSRLRRADPCRRPLNRLGLTVGKKLGGAVERNRAKRLMREAYRLTEAELGDRLSHGYLIVLAARTRILQAKEMQVREELQESFCRLGLVSGPEKNGHAAASTDIVPRD
ncbi:MAG: ribonuclease P protein component [Clostridia bacterium]|nr:ribonuclease P protein component [Clostridia bacterium]